jgi:hypothetical protein
VGDAAADDLRAGARGAVQRSGLGGGQEPDGGLRGAGVVHEVGGRQRAPGALRRIRAQLGGALQQRGGQRGAAAGALPRRGAFELLGDRLPRPLGGVAAMPDRGLAVAGRVGQRGVGVAALPR